MGRDALRDMLHGYFWERTDKMNWTKEQDDRLIEKLVGKYLTKFENLV